MADQDQQSDDTATFEMTSPDNFQTVDAIITSARAANDGIEANLNRLAREIG